MSDTLLARLRDLDEPEPAGLSADRVLAAVARRRRSRYAVWGTVLALGGLVGGLAVLRPGRTGGAVPASGPVTCPAVFVEPSGSWVPAKPTVDTGGHLVPPDVPLQVLACVYASGDVTSPTTANLPLTGSRAVTDGLSALAADLHWAPRSTGNRVCTSMAGPVTNQLLGLRYAGGVVWVAAQDEVNGCGPAGNGDDDYDLPGQLVGGAVKTGSWPTPTGDPCTVVMTGRYGDTEALVPGEPTSIDVCDRGLNGPPQRTTLEGARLSSLLEALRAVRTSRSDGSCGPSDTSTHQVSLVVRYAAGPPVLLHVQHECRPGVMGRALAAQDPTAVWQTLASAGLRFEEETTPPTSAGAVPQEATDVVHKYLESVLAGDCAATRPIVAAGFEGNGDICGHLTATGYDIGPAPVGPRDGSVELAVELHGVQWDPGGAGTDGEVTWFLTVTLQSDGMWRLTAGGTGP